jgi:hypothetical protein
MIWLTWRQIRAQAAAVGAAAAVLALALLVTGPGLRDLFEETGDGFVRALVAERGKTTLLDLGSIAALLLPAVLGVFWGAPLVARELEAGTHRLAWSQSVTRTRWLATRMGLTGLAAMAIAALLGLALAWWCKPIDAAILSGQSGPGLVGKPRVSPLAFESRGIAPIGYAAFAFALGVGTGAVLRRAVPAMAITLALVVGVQIAVPTVIRPHVAPASAAKRITQENFAGMSATVESGRPVGPVHDLMIDPDLPGAWITSQETIDASGKAVAALPSWMASCVAPPPPPPEGGVTRAPAGERRETRACFDRLAAAGYRQRVSYQPASRYWSLQAIETAGFLVLAGLLTGFTFWWVRRLA